MPRIFSTLTEALLLLLTDHFLYCSYAADNMRAEAKLASGDLYDSIIGPGFVGKRKRLTVPHQDDSSYAQDSRRFCRFPAVTDLVSD